jgi:hypothetical protein
MEHKRVGGATVAIKRKEFSIHLSFPLSTVFQDYLGVTVNKQIFFTEKCQFIHMEGTVEFTILQPPMKGLIQPIIIT